MTRENVNPIRLQQLLDQAQKLPHAERAGHVQRAAAQQWPGQVVKCAQGAHVGRVKRVFILSVLEYSLSIRLWLLWGRPDSMRVYSLTTKA